jgi:PAS domain S-box-containing protein
MPPPLSTVAQPIAVKTTPAIATPQEPMAIAPQPTFGGMTSSLYDDNASTSNYEFPSNGKKHVKRAANRRSAQLSRKRKKMFIEELKEENDELRRKEQILRSIPDLIVVFDSSGRLWFVSESVDRFLSLTVSELEGTSFWERLCEDSVRLLKAAFMDSLAARQPDSDTVPLGTGVWELRLVDKNGSQKNVTLNGVVHFAGERPECVCSIRPRDESSMKSRANGSQKLHTTSSEDAKQVKPQKSVVSNGSSTIMQPRRSKNHMVGKRGEAVRISDGGDSSADSESGSGSSDEMTAAAS